MSNNRPPLPPALKVIVFLLVLIALVLGMKSCASMREQQREEAQRKVFFEQLDKAINEAMKGE